MPQDDHRHDHHSRHLTWEGCLNARDLGGLSTHDGKTVRHGALVRADCPNYLTAAGRDSLVAHGVRTIVDVRLPDEATGFPYSFMSANHHGIRYVNASLLDPDFVPSDVTAADLPPLADDYKHMADANMPRIAAIVRSIAEAPEGGVLVHCAAGKDRTGLVVALLLDLAGVSRDLIAADYALSSENIRERQEAWVEEAPEEAEARRAMVVRGTTTPEVMVEVLAHLDARYGGTEDYLLAAGCTPEQLARVRARLVAED